MAAATARAMALEATSAVRRLLSNMTSSSLQDSVDVVAESIVSVARNATAAVSNGTVEEVAGAGAAAVSDALLSMAITAEEIEGKDGQLEEAMFTDHTSLLSLRQRQGLVVVSRISCTLSGFGSLFIIITYCTIPQLRRVFALQMVAFMAFCELLSACGVLLGSPEPEGDVCAAQSLVVAFAGLSSVLWTTVIANVLHLSVLRPTMSIRLGRWKGMYHAYVWLTTAALVALPYITDSYGFAGFNCWIKSDEVGQFWRFMQFYLPLWLAMFYNLYIYLSLYKALVTVIRGVYVKDDCPSSSSMPAPSAASTSSLGLGNGDGHTNVNAEIPPAPDAGRTRSSRHGGGGGSKGGGGVKLLYAIPLLLYPLNLLVCWIWGTVNRFQNWYNPGHPSYTLFVLQVLFGNLQGFFHFIAYLFSSNVRFVVMRRWKRFSAAVGEAAAKARGYGPVEAARIVLLAAFDEIDGGGGGAGEDDNEEEEENMFGGSELELTNLLPRDSSEDYLPEDLSPKRQPRRLPMSVSGERRRGTSLSDVSVQVRHAYVMSLGVYNLIGIDDNVQPQLYHQLSTLEQRTSKSSAGTEQGEAANGNGNGSSSALSSLLNHGHGGKAGTVATYFTLFKSFCGLGVLALPSAFRLAGYVGGTLGIIVIAGISHHCMELLMKCAAIAAARLQKRQLAQSQCTGNNQSATSEEPTSVTAATSMLKQTSENRAAKASSAPVKSDGSLSSASSDEAADCGLSTPPDKCGGGAATLYKKKSAKKVTISFGMIGEMAIGPLGLQLVDVCLVFSQVGFATAYLIFIGSNVYAVANGTGTPATYIFISAAAVMPLVWLKDLSNLALTSLLADVAILFGIITIFTYDLLELNAAGFNSNAKSLRISTLPLFFGVAVFAFEGIGLILPVQQSMERPEDMPGMLKITMMVLTILFIAMGALSYMAYGAATADMITLNLPRNSLVSCVQIFYCLGLFFTYPVMMFPAWKILEATSAYANASVGFLQRVRSTRLSSVLAARSMNIDDIAQRGFRFILVLGTAVIAVITPHFTLFVNLIGAVACTMLAFVLPAIFYLRLVDNPSNMLYAKTAAIVIFGLTGGAVCLYVTMEELLRAIAAETSPEELPEA